MPSSEHRWPPRTRLPKQRGLTLMQQRGLTLVELIATIVVLAIALVALSSIIASGISRSPNILMQTQALVLAQSYTDEILSKRFDENAPPNGIPPCHPAGLLCSTEAQFGPLGDAGESRASWDDVDDYHGLEEGYGFAEPLRDIDGQPRSGYDNFSVQVSVRYLDATENTLGIVFTDAKLISLTITHRSNPEGWKFGVYKANY